jgi:hypothetical protein
MDIFIEMHRNFLQGDECFYVMGNDSKIKIVKIIQRKDMGQSALRVSSLRLRVPGSAFKNLKTRNG